MKRRVFIFLGVILISLQTCLHFMYANGSSKSSKNAEETMLLGGGKYLLIMPKYEEIENISEDLLAVKLNGKWGFIDKKSGKVIIKPQFDDVIRFLKVSAEIKQGGGLGAVDKSVMVEAMLKVMPKFNDMSNFFR